MDAQLIAFTGVSAGLVALPGADFTVVVRNALVSRRAGIACALGIGAGLLVHVALAVVGITAVLAAVPALFRALQTVGGAYVLYLGVQTLRQPHNPVEIPQGGPAARPLRQGFVTNALNPKVSITFVSVLPQFVPAGAPTLPRTLLLALIMVAVALVWFQVVALLVDRLGRWLRRPRVARGVTAVTGAALTVFGAALLAGPLRALLRAF
ncbi:LysE family translocator [Streptomyces viridochromogenes]|uniref:Putative Lysine exporter protein (LYSE/YGGA) n=1 Tax=Streptomyces viridochromogenes Tue57 TaxID=1160705 RepID=L8P5R0_STRVR|nr:LysE family translocator [Streptomyces viridochromogenes]ELS51468.1 putative Lysine exporter protein (LYSE/YGGA) [Streptomyces viridochromogenes Tue57]